LIFGKVVLEDVAAREEVSVVYDRVLFDSEDPLDHGIFSELGRRRGRDGEKAAAAVEAEAVVAVEAKEGRKPRIILYDGDRSRGNGSHASLIIAATVLVGGAPLELAHADAVLVHVARCGIWAHVARSPDLPAHHEVKGSVAHCGSQTPRDVGVVPHRVQDFALGRYGLRGL